MINVLSVLGVLTAFGLGVACGFVITRGALRWRSNAWIRSRCAVSAAELQSYLGNPIVLRSAAALAARGHRYDRDRAFRRTLRQTLDQAFEVTPPQERNG